MKPAAPETPPDYDASRIIERPDGFYWQDRTSGKEYGPFATLLEAEQDMNYEAADDVIESEDLLEAEDEIGINDWIDPDTGEPAEEWRPHLDDR
jgi:hypothetical protein